jgi:hypothetical protein
VSWLVQYRAGNGVHMTTRHESRREAFETLADSLLASALVLWGLDSERAQSKGDHLVRHALRLCVEAEEDSPDGYLLRLSQGRKWVVCPV